MGLLEQRVRGMRVGMRVRGGGSEVQSRPGDRTVRGTLVGNGSGSHSKRRPV